jgi:hypothetical protein
VTLLSTPAARFVSAILALWSGTAPLVAGPREDLILAAMRLGEAPNYAWLTTVTDDARIYTVEGRTVRGDLTHILQPLVNQLRRPLGLGSTETQVEFFFRGNRTCVIATPHGWLTPEEILALPDPSPGPGRSQPGAAAAPLSLPRVPPASAPRPFSNLQLAISHPHEELAMLVAGLEELRLQDGVALGSLAEVTARLLLVHDGQEQVEPVRAAGRFRLWVEHRLVRRYELHLEGILRISAAGTSRDVAVRQVSATVVREVGATGFPVPEAVRARLGQPAHSTMNENATIRVGGSAPQNSPRGDTPSGK